MDKKNYETLKFQQFDGYARVTINRPDVLNALNEVVIEEMHELLFEEIDPEITRIVVIEGAGGKAFVAGADIKPMSEMNPEDALEFARAGQALTRAMETMQQVFVAKVSGYALGGGLELMMACDIVVASDKAVFGAPEVNLGLIPGFGGTQRLVRRVGLPLAMDMILSGNGRKLNASEALACGLVSRVVSAEELDTEVDKVVKSILAAGPAAVSEAKRLVLSAASHFMEEGLGSEASSFANCFAREESAEGMSAFIQKRKPKFEL